MYSFKQGFTIVEIIIVIAIIGILAAITLVSWDTVRDASSDQANRSAVESWANNFETYRGQFFTYPVMPVNTATPAMGCLGKMTASSNRCGVYANMGQSMPDTTADALLSEMEKVGDAPKNSVPTVIGRFAGPMYRVTQSSNTPPYTVTANFFSYFREGCPPGFTNVTNTSPYNTYLPSSIASGTLLCSLQKTFTFDPN